MGLGNILAYIGELIHLLLINASEIEALWQLVRGKRRKK